MSGGLLSPSSPALCNAKYRGELRSVATRRGLKKPAMEVIELTLLSPCRVPQHCGVFLQGI